jgi:hypothetical protein
MGLETEQAYRPSHEDDISCVCNPIRTGVASLSPGSDEWGTVRIIAVRRSRAVRGRIEAQWMRLHTSKRTSQEHRLVCESSVFRGRHASIHALERDGAKSTALSAAVDRPLPAEREKRRAPPQQQQQQASQPPCCAIQLRRAMRNACSARRRMREGKSRARPTPTKKIKSAHNDFHHSQQCFPIMYNRLV